MVTSCWNVKKWNVSELTELKSQTNMGKLEWRMRTYSGDCSYEEKDQLGLDM